MFGRMKEINIESLFLFHVEVLGGSTLWWLYNPENKDNYVSLHSLESTALRDETGSGC